MSFKNAFQELVSDNQRAIKSAREQIAALRKNRVVLNKIGRVAKKLESKHQLSGNLFVNRLAGGMYLYARAENLNGFNDGAALELLEAFEKVGVEFNRSRDYAADGYRVFEGMSGDGLVRVEISAYLKKDAARCRRVLKSVKKVDVPEYEFVCS